MHPSLPTHPLPAHLPNYWHTARSPPTRQPACSLLIRALQPTFTGECNLYLSLVADTLVSAFSCVMTCFPRLAQFGRENINSANVIDFNRTN